MVRTLVSAPCLQAGSFFAILLSLFMFAVIAFELIFATSHYLFPWTPVGNSQTFSISNIPYYAALDAGMQGQIYGPLSLDYILLYSDIVLRPVIPIALLVYLATMECSLSLPAFAVTQLVCFFVELAKLIFRGIMWINCANYWVCFTPGSVAPGGTALATTEFITIFAVNAFFVAQAVATACITGCMNTGMISAMASELFQGKVFLHTGAPASSAGTAEHQYLPLERGDELDEYNLVPVTQQGVIRSVSAASRRSKQA
jgi:hypothetical protein